MRTREQRLFLDPVDELLTQLAVGAEERDLDRCDVLATGMESLSRYELALSYGPFPPESTTDGTSIHVCHRSATDTLDIAGVVWIDFDGWRFPFRAVITRNDDQALTVVYSIGAVDPVTGAPPRLPSGVMVFQIRDEEDRLTGLGLLERHRVVPITWTEVLVHEVLP